MVLLLLSGLHVAGIRGQVLVGRHLLRDLSGPSFLFAWQLTLGVLLL